jgi:hypothetical protein
VSRGQRGGSPTVVNLSFLYREIGIYNAIIFLVVLYRCETWYLTLREKQRLRVLIKDVFWDFVPFSTRSN